MDDTSDDEGGERVEFTTSKDLQVFPTFEAMGLKEDLLRGIYNYGACLLIPRIALQQDTRPTSGVC